MFSLTRTETPEKVAVNEHCKLRQLSEMVQSPDVATDKVWVLKLLREAHIWDSVALGAHVGGSSGGDGEGDGRAVEVGRAGLEEGQLSAQCM